MAVTLTLKLSQDFFCFKGLGIGVEEINIDEGTNFCLVFPGSLPPQKVLNLFAPAYLSISKDRVLPFSKLLIGKSQAFSMRSNVYLWRYTQMRGSGGIYAPPLS